MDDFVGAIVGGTYRVIRFVGRGGMACVYEVAREPDGATLALKLLAGLSSSAQHAERFRREVRAVARLEHDGIVRVLDSGLHQGRYYYVMEYVSGWALSVVLAHLRAGNRWEPGQTATSEGLEGATQISIPPADSQADTVAPHRSASAASREVTERSPLTEAAGGEKKEGAERRVSAAIERRGYIDEMCRIAVAAARALAHAHTRGVVHRDIKPDNLLLDHDGNVYVSDFGLATVAEEDADGRLTIAGELLGTPLYMSPEQIGAGRIPVDQRTDVYSLGVTLYEMLALQPPHTASTREALLQAVAVKEAPPLRSRNAGVPPALAAVVHHAIEKDPDRRYQSMEALAEDLEAFRQGAPVRVRTVGPLRRMWRRRRRAGRVTLVSLLALSILVAGLVVRTFRHPAGGNVSPVQQAEFLQQARDAASQEDWERALLWFAQAGPIEQRDIVALETDFALQQVLPPVARLPYFGPGPRFAVSRDGETMAVCDGANTARILRGVDQLADGVPIRHAADDLIQQVQFSGSGEQVITRGLRALRCWRADGALLATWPVPRDRQITDVRIDRAGRWCLVRHAATETAEINESVTLLRRDDEAARWSPVAEIGSVVDASLQPDGSMAAVVSRTGAISVIGLAEALPQTMPLPMRDGIPYRRVWCQPGTAGLITFDAEGRWHAHEGLSTDEGFASHTFHQSAFPPVASDARRVFARSLCGGRRLLMGVPRREGDDMRFDLGLYDAQDLSNIADAITATSVWVSSTADRFVASAEEGLEIRDAESARSKVRLARPQVADSGEAQRPTLASPEGRIRGAIPGGWEALHAAAPGETTLPIASLDAGGQIALRMEAVAGGSLLHIWDVDTGTLLARWRCSDPALAWASVHPAGQWLLLGYRDGHIMVRDLEALVRPYGGVPIESVGRGVLAAAVAPESSSVAIVTNDAGESLHIWSAGARSAEQRSWAVDGTGRDCLAVCPEGNRLALRAADGQLLIVAENGAEIPVGRAGSAIEAFAFDRGFGDATARGVGFAGTLHGELLMFGLDRGVAARRMETGLGGILAIDRTQQTIAVLDGRKQCALVYVGEKVLSAAESQDQAPESRWPVAGRATVFNLNPEGSVGAIGDAVAGAGHGSVDRGRIQIALAGTQSPDLFLLAVSGYEQVELWLLKRKAFGQPQNRTRRLGGPLRFSTPTFSPVRSPASARQVAGLAFLPTSAGGLELVAVLSDGVVKRWPVFSGQQSGDVTTSSDEIWRSRIRQSLGRELNAATGRVQPVAGEGWEAAGRPFEQTGR